MSYGKDMLDKLNFNKNRDGNKLILEKTKGTFTGGAIGLIVGLYIGHSRNYNLLTSAFIGASLGGLITNFLINKNK